MKNEPSLPENDWVDCANGELTHVAFPNHTISRRQAINRITTGVVTIAAAATAGAIFWTASDTVTVEDQEIAPISCRMVLRLLPKYVGKGIGDHVLITRIDRHLGHCGYCNNRHTQLASASPRKPQP